MHKFQYNNIQNEYITYRKMLLINMMCKHWESYNFFNVLVWLTFKYEIIESIFCLIGEDNLNLNFAII